MSIENHYVKDDNDNVTIHSRFFSPDLPQKAVEPNSIKENSQLIAIICHPHPQFGGNMNNNVVLGIKDVLVKKGIKVVTFNFRGVGKSTGEYSNGIGEQKDLVNIANFTIKNALNSSNLNDLKIILIGYSFGAIIALAALNQITLEILAYKQYYPCFIALSSIILIAYPFGFMDSIHPVYDVSIPKLFINGKKDDIAKINVFQTEYEKFRTPKEKLIIDSADHFFSGAEKHIGENIYSYTIKKQE